MKDGFKRHWKTLLKATVALTLLAVLFSTSGLESTLVRLQQLKPWTLWAATGLLLVCQVMSAWRWQMLSAPFGFSLGLGRYVDLYLNGMFASLFLPGSVGGDVVKAVGLAKATDQKKRWGIATVMADRVIGFSALVFALMGLMLLPNFQAFPASAKWISYSIAAGTTGFWLLWLGLPWQRWKVPNALSRFFPTEEGFVALLPWKQSGMLAKTFAISLISHAFMVLLHFIILVGLQLPSIPWDLLALVYGLSSMMAVIPISINGTGLREGTYVLLLLPFGVPQADALAIGLVFFLTNTLVSLIGGLLWACPLQLKSSFLREKKVTD